MKGNPLALAALGIFCALPATAANGPHEDPGSSGSVGLFAVPRASTFGRGKGSFSVFYETLAREEGSSNVERAGFTAAYGITDRLEVFSSLEPRVGIKREYLIEDAIGFPRELGPRLNDHPFAVDRFSDAFGDLRFGVKMKLLGEGYSGLAVQGVIKIPTSKDEQGIGTGKLDFGADVIGSLELGEAIGLNGFTGMYRINDPDEFDLANEIRWGMGLQAPTRFWLQGLFEFYGVRYINKPDEFDSLIGFQNYRIIQGGFRLSFNNGLAISGGVNKNLSIDDFGGIEPERIGSFVQVSFSMRPQPLAPQIPPPPPAAFALNCRADATTVRVGESVRITADASGPATIQWTATEGTLTPTSGPSVTWSSAGVPMGTTVTITATASGRETASCQVRVRVEEPPPPRQPSTRTMSCTEFAARSARIDNRCKAVLDDVAVQLRSNSSATVRITGYGDDARDPARARTLANQRAQNASAYLTRTHGIDASRIMAGAGSGQSRTVDLELTVP
jgi:outer membrane protein OmpA-like peptidoglycan-associated protein